MKVKGNHLTFLTHFAHLFFFYLLSLSIAYAECVKDLSGEVYCGAGNCVIESTIKSKSKYGKIWCSRYYKGGAIKTLNGEIVCGKGKCMKDFNGVVYCSSEIGGDVLRDSKGKVRCYGQCEPGTIDNCENSVADSSE